MRHINFGPAFVLASGRCRTPQFVNLCHALFNLPNTLLHLLLYCNDVFLKTSKFQVIHVLSHAHDEFGPVGPHFVLRAKLPISGTLFESTQVKCDLSKFQ